MDLITQTVLGAAVGEVVLGKKAGNKAIVWGAVGGIIPDLDVLVAPFYSQVEGLFVHRGFSHSLIFAFLLAPIVGWVIHKIHQKSTGISWLDWSKLIFWSAFTHPILDYFTNYGTGAFTPFSDYRVEFGTIGIVDLFYTIPFILAIFIVLFFKRTSIFRQRLMLVTVVLTSIYLLGTVANKIFVNSVFEESFASSHIKYNRYKTVPLPLSNFLWMGVAEVDNGYYLALYSVFDKEKPQSFEFVPRNEDKLEHLINDKDLMKLIQFTKGYYHVGKDENGLYLADLRFGKAGIAKDADYIFKFKLKEENGELLIEESDRSRSFKEDAFSAYIERIKGI